MDYLVGIIIGTVLGLTGAGGSVFAVPLLIYWVQLSPQDAIGISLGAVFASALFGTLTQIKTKKIQWLPAIVYAVIGSAVAPVGIYLNKQIDANSLMLAFSVLVVIVAMRMWKQAAGSPQEAEVVRSSLTPAEQHDAAICRVNHNAPFHIGLPCIAGIGLGAVATGMLSGLFGVGGGFLIVPTLLFLTGISIQQAVGTSLVIISIVSLTGFISYLTSAEAINFTLLSHVVVGGIVGMAAGVFISRYIAGPRLQKLFSVLMLAIAAMTVYSTLIQ